MEIGWRNSILKNNELLFPGSLACDLSSASHKEIRKDPPRVSGRGELCMARQLDKSTSWVKNERARQPRVKRVYVGHSCTSGSARSTCSSTRLTQTLSSTHTLDACACATRLALSCHARIRLLNAVLHPPYRVPFVRFSSAAAEHHFDVWRIAE